eukprot:TRINITY_DN6698_c1_g1_i5.p1 TRINITY_DN6698_c1_g1~~TRINITY_DN6698_c1_g1_i5.p1  ORF type:complete len:221 (+),score=15.62 TRINITY_DN6698_c1_g1_i5:140-802(+)
MNVTRSRKNDWVSNSVVRSSLGGCGVSGTTIGYPNEGFFCGYDQAAHVSELRKNVRERDDSPWTTYLHYSKADKSFNSGGSRSSNDRMVYHPLSAGQVDADIKSMITAHAAPIVKLSYEDIFDIPKPKPSQSKSCLPCFSTTTPKSVYSCTYSHNSSIGYGKDQLQCKGKVRGSGCLEKQLQERANLALEKSINKVEAGTGRVQGKNKNCDLEDPRLLRD